MLLTLPLALQSLVLFRLGWSRFRILSGQDPQTPDVATVPPSGIREPRGTMRTSPEVRDTKFILQPGLRCLRRMTDLESLIAKLTKGFALETKTAGKVRRIIGTKKTGFLQSNERILLVVFEGEQPSVDKVDTFFDEAKKFYEANRGSYAIPAIYLVTPAAVEKATFKALVKRAPSPLPEKIKTKTYGAAEEEEEPEAPTTAPSATRSPVQTDSALPKVLDTALAAGAHSSREKVLYAWEMIYQESGKAQAPVVVAVTQERCLTFRRVGREIIPHGKEHRWDEVTYIDLGGEPGTEFVKINETTREVHLIHPEADFISRTMYHLWWTRRGFLTGFGESYNWDPGLVDSTKESMLKGNYPEAVRNGYAHVETKLRMESNLPDGTDTDTTLVTAFNPEKGLFRSGSTKGEAEGVFAFARGSFSVFRNPSAHGGGNLPDDREKALQALGIANAILGLAARGKLAQKNRPLIRPGAEPGETY